MHPYMNNDSVEYKMKKLCLLVILSVVWIFALWGCDMRTGVKYPNGRDTVKGFGDGRFQITRLPGNVKQLDDCQQKITIAKDVYDWRVVGHHVCLFDRSETVFVVLDFESGNFDKYKAPALAPVEFRAALQKTLGSKKPRD